MTRTVLVAGTASHAGKSTVVAGLCRHLANRGVSVAPYKAQNMSNNARVVPAVDGTDGEIGVSQYVQARAARTTATVDSNPVLLKPRGDGESQLVVQGAAREHVRSREYYADHWHDARDAAIESYERLAADHDVVVAEGAGSIAEINLQHRDLANIEAARFADATVLLVADIERGGAFASLYGTIELLPDDVRERVAGAVFTKFRGDPSLLDDGIEELESRTGVPILGVIPYDDPGLPAEDSLSLPDDGERTVVGDDDGVPAADAVTVAVPLFPRISNFTDLEPLAREPGVRVAYVPLEGSLDDADAVVLPGTKNTVDDLLALDAAGFDEALRSFDGPVVGLCGGYQMLGERITNADVESTGSHEVVDGLGLLPVETAFREDKRVTRVTTSVDGVGPLAGATGTVSGYEIHMGRSTPTGSVARPVGSRSAATETVLGTYVHGLFENQSARRPFVENVFEDAGKQPPEAALDRQSPYERAADLVAANVQLAPLVGDIVRTDPA